MRFDRDLLIFKALCALMEYADASHKGPLKPTMGLAFTLAFLRSQSNGDLRCYTEFWDHVQKDNDPNRPQGMEDYIRATYSHSALNGIMATLKWNCPGLPYQMISEVRTGASANVVFRTARQRQAELEA